MSTDIVSQLAEFSAKTRYEDVPEEVVDFTKGLILKTVAGMVAGSKKPAGKKMAKIIKAHKGLPEATTLGSGFKTSLWDAVLLNAFYAHASELEDDRFNGGVSWDITVIPLLVSLAEKLGLTGRAFLEAAIVGLEVTCRTCLFVNPPMEVGHVPGAVGPAAGAARALGLDTDQISGAMGLALPGVPQLHVSLGTDAHYFESAMMSLTGIMSAEMAKLGMKGSTNIARYLSRFWGKEFVVPEKMVEDLGRRWLLTEIWIKKYPCCFATHRQIDVAIELRKQNKLTADAIETIEIHSGLADKVVDRPEPRTAEDVQFSLQHVVASAIIDGDVTLRHLTPEAINDPRIVALRSRAKVIYHPDWVRKVVGAPARLTVKTKDGKEFTRERMWIIGSPNEPITMAQFRDLHFKFLRDFLPEDRIAKSADMIMGMEKLDSLEGLVKNLKIASSRK